jgi:hypothetical protein
MLRRRLFTIFAVGALLVSSGAAMAGASSSTGPRVAAKVRAAKPAGIGLPIIYSQNDNDAGVGISSQNFEASLDAFDDEAADDFTIPAGQRWIIRAVIVTGSYFNSGGCGAMCGPADSETVSFYRNAAGLPGTLISTQTVVGTDNAGSFTIRLASPVRLRPGTYWVSVVANQNFDPNDQWAWQTRSIANGNESAWQNPGDGFATGCVTWGNQQDCIGDAGQGPDFMFALFGRVA